MRHPVWRIFMSITVAFIAMNLFFINLRLYDAIYKNKSAAFTYVVSPTPQAEPTPPSNMCPNNCLNIIKNATASAQQKITTAPTQIVKTAQPTQPPTVREFFIPLGTGTTASDSWTDVPGAQAMIDAGQYSAIKSVTFEAAVYVPDHNEGVWVRLYNSTDNYTIGGSELYFADGNKSALMITGSIGLGAGNKLYKVQMKTQLKFPANLTNARIHILTN